jgi:hypothetical protein
VTDATGLEDGWDFTLCFSSPALVKGVDAATLEPNGAVSLPEVLVIDPLDRTPTEN